MFEPRRYRENMGRDRFESFGVAFKETDLWIGVDRESFRSEMADFVLTRISELRSEIEAYCEVDELFLKELSPYDGADSASPVVSRMFEYGRRADVGPMASVAGVFAQEIGQIIDAEFGVGEIVVENGGDLFLKVRAPVVISAFAGLSPLSEKVGLKIDPEYSPLGICTSSGTVGHSFSLGKADAVVVVCQEAGLADAYATSFCNKIRGEEDVEPVLDEIAEESPILGALIVVEERLGVRGVFPLEILRC